MGDEVVPGSSLLRKQEGAKSYLYVRGGKKSIEMSQDYAQEQFKLYCKLSLGLGIWFLSFAGRTDSALGLGRLTEAEASPGNRSKADFRFGVTHIRSL